MIVRDELTIIRHVLEEIEGVLATSAAALLALGHDADVHVGSVGHRNVFALGLHIELAKGAVCNQSGVLDVDVAGAWRMLNSQVATVGVSGNGKEWTRTSRRDRDHAQQSPGR